MLAGFSIELSIIFLFPTHQTAYFVFLLRGAYS